MADMLRSALWYARRGLHVFACLARGKAPATAHGCLDATIDPSVIASMWSDPSRNVAIACGPSQLCVIDIDGAAGAESLAALEDVHGELPATWQVITRTGHHYYFAARAARTSVRSLGAGIDTRGAGGYVLAPPSVHPSGHVYHWAEGRGPHEIALAPLPSWIAEALVPREPERSAEPIAISTERIGAYARAALTEECLAIMRAPQGTRNHRLNSAAYSIGQIVGAGMLDRSFALDALLESGRRAGLQARECIATASSGLGAGMREPRRLAS